MRFFFLKRAGSLITVNSGRTGALLQIDRKGFVQFLTDLFLYYLQAVDGAHRSTFVALCLKSTRRI